MNVVQVERQGGGPLRVLYIMGCGRSGSTMLGTILGNHPQMESPGELCYAAEKAYLRGAYCACGEWGFDCDFWSEVRRQWARQTSTSDVQRYAALVRKFEARRFWLNGIARQLAAPQGEFKEYQELTVALLRSIQAASGRPVIVDCSKRPARAFILSQTPGIDLRVVHLVRDCRGAAWSAQKRLARNERGGVSNADPGKSVYKAAALWVAGNMLSTAVRLRMDESRSIRVRYEDYVTRPVETLAAIGRLAGISLDSLAAELATGLPLSSRHVIAGNRLRMSARLQLRADTEWQEKLPVRHRRVCWMIGGRLLRQYGYSRVPPLPDGSPARHAA